MSDLMPLLEVNCISKKYYKKNLISDALKPCTFSLNEGEILGIIGESGSGKSTLLKILSGLENPTSGYAKLAGKEITNSKTGFNNKNRKNIYKNLQMIFQNPIGSFNPREKVRHSIFENITNLCPNLSLSEKKYRIDSLLEKVEIEPELTDRYPHKLSGGQCQRIAIARALSVEPKILLCDEATSALDVLTQNRVIELLLEFSKELNIAIIFVSHDLSLSYNFCKKVMVMKNGICVESGEISEVFNRPKNSYTQKLISASIDPVTYIGKNKNGKSRICKNESKW